MAKKHTDQHGRKAKRPGEIPKKGWKDIFMRVKKENSKDNVGILAAGVAFYAFLSLFPLIAAVISIYGLVTDPQTVQQQLAGLADVLPPQSRQLIQQQLSQITQGSPTALGWGLIFSVLLSIWSANKGTRALFQGLNITYDEQEKRGFFKLNAVTLLFTLLGIIGVIISMVLVVALPVAITNLNLPGPLEGLLRWGRWILLAMLIMGGLALLYRYAPYRENPQWRWVSWGSVISTILWIVGSWAFSFYVSNFGNYNATYGSLAAVVILLLWFFLSGYIILLGAEINSEIEHQTEVDTTTGKEKPLGKRGAHDADTLGEAA